MVKKSSFCTNRIFQTFSIALATLILYQPTHSHAQTNNPTPPPATLKKTVTYGTPVAVLPQSYYAVSFFQYPIMSENAFMMRLSQYGTVSGCAHMQHGEAPLGYEARATSTRSQVKYIGPRMEVMLDVPMVANNDGKPRYSEHDCEISHLESYVDLRFDRDQLIKKNIKEFVFKIPEADLGKYEVDISKERLIFKSKISEEISEEWLTLWFFPRGTIKLYTPDAKQGMDVISKIRNFGKENGLIPLEEVLDGYTLPHQANDYTYFVDPEKTYLKQLSPKNNNKHIGDIIIQKTFYGGSNGSKEIEIPLPVYATVVIERKTIK